MSSQKSVLAFCALNMGLTMLHTAFSFYYVKVFLNQYQIKESWFHFAQILYMVWNAVNDPLFAILQDNTNFILTRTRREGILYTGPIFALSFLIPWFQFGDSPWAVGLHLIISLFLYDTMFTFIGLLSCCLFTELSSDPFDRLKLTRYSQITSLIGVQCILFLEYTSSSLQNFYAFQLATVCLAILCCVLTNYAGHHAHTQYDVQRKAAKECVTSMASEKSNGSQKESFFRKMVQLFTERNFIAFVSTDFFQEFHLAFWGGFTAILCDYLVPTDHVPASVRSFFYGMTGTCGGVSYDQLDDDTVSVHCNNKTSTG